jgi:hypothetical protein
VVAVVGFRALVAVRGPVVVAELVAAGEPFLAGVAFVAGEPVALPHPAIAAIAMQPRTRRAKSILGLKTSV